MYKLFFNVQYKPFESDISIAVWNENGDLLNGTPSALQASGDGDELGVSF